MDRLKISTEEEEEKKESNKLDDVRGKFLVINYDSSHKRL